MASTRSGCVAVTGLAMKAALVPMSGSRTRRGRRVSEQLGSAMIYICARRVQATGSRVSEMREGAEQQRAASRQLV